MATQQLPVDPRALVREFRGNYVNLHTLWTKGPHAPQGVTLHTPQETPIREADLPDGISKLLADYRKNHPGARIDLLKYQRVENGQPTLVVEDDSGLPDEDELLSLSHTVTLTTSTEVQVLTEIVVAHVTTT